MQSNQDYIPIRVNEPKMVGPFSINDVRPVMVGVIIGAAVDMMNACLIVGVGLSIIQVQLSKHFPPGFLFHYFWYQGLLPLRTSTYLPDPIKRKFYQ